MNTLTKNLKELLELANNYPSPHNGQPIRIKIVNDANLELFFDKSRGLQAADISFIFSFVSMGVFIEYLSTCASALGHAMTYKLALPNEKDLRGSGLIKFADCKFQWGKFNPKSEIVKYLCFRQTSRKKYFEGVDIKTLKESENIAESLGMKLFRLDNKQARETIWLNQRAVFDDMFDGPTRKELDYWLRYSKKEKEEKLDGLAYDCMELNGNLIKFIVNHYKILRLPGVSTLIKNYYLRTMRDNSDVCYMLAPFQNESDSFMVGISIMKIWNKLSENGYHLHPFGTIMSNHLAHRDFIQLTGVRNESREKNYLVFIFRAGKSDAPSKSMRLPIHKHLVIE